MKWSKAWFVLVALVGAAGVAAAVAAPFLVQRELDRQVGRRLTAAADSGLVQVQLLARRWIDAASHAALDVQLAEALDHASTGSADPELLHKTALERLRSFQAEWKVLEVVAVDAHARVVARAAAGPGPSDDRWKDDLASAQVVTEALKGFRLDDSFFDDGRLVLAAAAPVLVRDHVAGALLVELDLGATLVQTLADKLGVEVALAAGGKSVALSAHARAVDAAIAALKPMPATMRGPVLLGDEPDRLMVASSLPGSTAVPAYLIVAEERSLLSSPAVLRDRVLASLEQIPWRNLAAVAGGLLAAILVFLYLAAREHTAPLQRLEKALHAVALGDAVRVEARGADRRHAALVRAVNAALERARTGQRVFAGMAASATVRAAPSIALESAPPEPWTAPPEPWTAPPEPWGAAAPLDRPLPSWTPPPLAEEPEAPSPLAAAKASLPLQPLSAALPESLASGPVFAPGRGGPAPMEVAVSGPNASFALDELSAVDTVAETSGLLAAMEPPPLAPEPQGIPAPFDDEMQVVYSEFLDTRQRCGESIDGMTFDRFAAKLRYNREQLIDRYQCTAVRFQVYVKDGKAALKATPIT